MSILVCNWYVELLVYIVIKKGGRVDFLLNQILFLLQVLFIVKFYLSSLNFVWTSWNSNKECTRAKKILQRSDLNHYFSEAEFIRFVQFRDEFRASL